MARVICGFGHSSERSPKLKSALVVECLLLSLFISMAITSRVPGSSSSRRNLGHDTSDVEKFWIQEVKKVFAA
jgi:hypothetical protein